MEKEMLLSELTKNCNGNNEKLMELMKTYELAKLGGDVQQQQINDIYNRILETHEFFAKTDAKRLGISKGDRITTEEFMFLLSDKDFGKLMELSHPVLVKEKICDEKGYYITNWNTIELNAMNELVDFIILNIVPSQMRPLFWKSRRSVVFEHKLISALQGCTKAA